MLLRRSRPMGRFPGHLALIATLLTLHAPHVLAASRDEGNALEASVRRALESGDAAALRRLFPADHKVRVSLSRIADLQGFVGPGPLVEAFRRYLVSRTEVRFDLDDGAGKHRVRGTLCSRDKAGRRDKIGLVFLFEKSGGELRAVEVRDTG